MNKTYDISNNNLLKNNTTNNWGVLSDNSLIKTYFNIINDKLSTMTNIIVKLKKKIEYKDKRNKSKRFRD